MQRTTNKIKQKHIVRRILTHVPVRAHEKHATYDQKPINQEQLKADTIR